MADSVNEEENTPVNEDDLLAAPGPSDEAAGDAPAQEMDIEALAQGIGKDVLAQEDLDALLSGLTETSDMQPVDEPEQQEEVMAPQPAFRSPASSPLQFASFDDESVSGDAGSSMEGFERVQDISLEVTVELGRTTMLIRDVLELSTGSIVELDKMAGEPVDLFANGLLVARGEVVVIEDNVGVRVTEIITSADRSEAGQNRRVA